MNPHIAFYVGRHENILMRIVLWLVSIISDSKITHCEFGDGNLMIGASAQNGGVFKIKGNRSGKDWILLPIDNSIFQKAKMLYEEEKNAKYDWFGALRFAIPLLNVSSSDRWFCSEFCANSIGLEKPWRYLPSDLYKHLTGKYL